ncbi:MAG: nucleoside deaminase [Deltaproteobacteria bacterium]|nr:nucleoside deaminase [Deltaproteobacteria bacterium]
MGSQDIFFMFQAVNEARKAQRLGEVPIGAVLVHQGQVLTRQHNQKEKTQDPTSHAEILCLREASSKLGSWRLVEATLYVTVEPCVMCVGALLQARVGRVVFGCLEPKMGGLRSVYSLNDDHRLHHQFIIEEGLLEDQCQSLMQNFFKLKRQQSCVIEKFKSTLP